MDEQGNSKAETERRDRRRRQTEEKGEPVVEEELDDLTDEVDDFNTPKDANKVYARIRKTKKGLMIRLGLSVVLFALMCYLTVSPQEYQSAAAHLHAPREEYARLYGRQPRRAGAGSAAQYLHQPGRPQGALYPPSQR